MFKKLNNIFDFIVSAVVVLLIVVTFGLIGMRFAGMYVFTVLSGSMEPTYPTGSMILVKPVDVDSLEPGDVITYLISDNTLVTHRITDIVPDETNPDIIRFCTKGDANNTVDMLLVHENNVVGTPFFCVPKLGYAVAFLKNPQSKYIIIAAISLVVLLTFLPDLFVKDEEENIDSNSTTGDNTAEKQPEIAVSADKE